jgi:hypothetical protein
MKEQLLKFQQIKSDLAQTVKHAIKILLLWKNIRFLRRTNLNTKPLGNILKT